VRCISAGSEEKIVSKQILKRNSKQELYETKCKTSLKKIVKFSAQNCFENGKLDQPGLLKPDALDPITGKKNQSVKNLEF
jgi:hypothetical protein